MTVITVFTSSVEVAGSGSVTPVIVRFNDEVAAAVMSEAVRLLAAVAAVLAAVAAAVSETFATAKERVYSAL